MGWQPRTRSIFLPGTQRHAADNGGKADVLWDPAGQPGIQTPGEPSGGADSGAGPCRTRGSAHVTPRSAHSCSQQSTRRKANIFRLVVLFESFNSISQIPRGTGVRMCLALTAPVRCVGVGADQQWDVQLLGWVSDGEDDLGESREVAGGLKSWPKAAPAQPGAWASL